MTASWMLASVLVSLLLAAAAMTWERVVALKRGIPLRWTWVMAMGMSAAYAGSLLMPSAVEPEPVGALSVSAPAAGASGAPTSSIQGGPPSFVGTQRTWKRLALAIRLPQLPASLDPNIPFIWGGLSSLLLLLLMWSGLRLVHDRRAWHAASVRSQLVLVSDGFGPAIVGVFSPMIVVPPWVLTLDEVAQETILAHEDEHRRAGDARLLLAGLGLLVLMPWNIGMWMMWRRLGRAIELDCDERVVARGVADADYANVLLGAWQRAHGISSWVPSPAFAERASGLGRRVEHLMRPAPRRWLMKAIAGSFVTAILAGAVLLVPSPPLAQGVASPKGGYGTALTWGLIVIDGVKRKDLSSEEVMRAERKVMYARGDSIASMQFVDSANAVRLYGVDGANGAIALWTKRYIARGGAVLPRSVVENGGAVRANPATTTPAEMTGRIYARLFRDITLSPASEAKARVLIAQEQEAQRKLNGPYLSVWPKRITLTTQRDEQLLALVTSPRDRALFEAHAEEGTPGKVQTVEEVARTALYNYFLRIDVLVADLERCTKIIEASLVAERDLYNRAPGDTAGRQAVLAKRDSDVRAALSSEATRLAFDKRQESLRRIKD